MLKTKVIEVVTGDSKKGAGKLREETVLLKGYGGNPKRDGCGLARGSSREDDKI